MTSRARVVFTVFVAALVAAAVPAHAQDSAAARAARPRGTVVLRFQLIEAQSVPYRDTAIAALDTTLHRLFGFAGYRLLSRTMLTAGEAEAFTATVPAREERLSLNGGVAQLVNNRGAVGAQLQVNLDRSQTYSWLDRPLAPERLLSTGLTAPLGQTVVVGSTAPGAGIEALILVMRADLSPGALR